MLARIDVIGSLVGNTPLQKIRLSGANVFVKLEYFNHSGSIKEKFPRVKVIAVDIEGSVIFGGPPQRRLISGIGSSKIPPILEHAIIDEVLYVTHEDTGVCRRH
jgi:cysteine synthase